jgi:hypothetical protein
MPVPEQLGFAALAASADASDLAVDGRRIPDQGCAEIQTPMPEHRLRAAGGGRPALPRVWLWFRSLAEML